MPYGWGAREWALAWRMKERNQPYVETYWERPERVARYYNLIRSAPPGWQAPEWMDKDKIKAAYDYFRFRNDDKNWAEWKFLPAGDPGRSFLQSIPTPPLEVMWPSERPAYLDVLTQEQVDVQKPFGAQGEWEALRPSEQFLYAISAQGQPPMEGAPTEMIKWTGNIVPALMTGMMGAALGTALGPLGIIGGFAAGAGAQFYQGVTGQQIPILNNVMQLFGFSAAQFEKLIGVGYQAAGGGIQALQQGKGFTSSADAVADVLSHWSDAWKAGQFTYETVAPDAVNAYMATLGQAIDLATGKWGGEYIAKPGEVWQIQKGISGPQTRLGPGGMETLTKARHDIETLLGQGVLPEDAISMIYADVIDRFGFTGTFNDFVYQTLLDPNNLVAPALDLVGAGSARILGKERLARAFETSVGNGLIDLLPMGIQQIASAVTGQRASAGPRAAWEMYRNWIKIGYSPGGLAVPAKDLSVFEKWAGGLTPEGKIKELQPTGQQNFVRYLKTLSPTAKSHVLLNMAHDNLNTLLSLAESNPETMVKLIRQAAGVDPVTAAGLGEKILGSPATATIQAALRQALSGGIADEMLASWKVTEGKRLILQKLSDALGEKPANILQQMADSPDQLIARLNDKTKIIGTPDFIKATLGVFVGDDALPWNPNQFQASLAVHLFDNFDDWLKTNYHLAPDNSVFRASQVLKGMQSFVLLGLNPAYFINNWVNNIVTRAADGVFGYMTPRQINAFMDRFGIKPSRFEVGIGPAEEIAGGLDAVRRLTSANDAIGKTQRVVSAVNKKLGIFSKFSVDVEKMEGKQAFTIAMKRFFKGAWKEEQGFQRMPPGLEVLLDRQAPGVKDAIYAVVRAGANMQEIEAGLYGAVIKPTIDGVIENVAQQIAPNSPELLVDLMHSTGIADKLASNLANADTPEAVDRAFAGVEQDLGKILDEHHARQVIDRAEEVKNIIGQEKLPGLLRVYGDMEIDKAKRWIAGRREFEDLYARRETMTSEQWSKEVRALFAKQDGDWQRTNELEVQTFAGIIKAIGIENENTQGFVTQLKQSQQAMSDYHKAAKKLRDAYFDQIKRGTGETYETWAKRRNLEWNKLQDQLDEAYVKATNIEKEVQMRMDLAFAQAYSDATGWDPTRAAGWRQGVRDIRYEMVGLQRAHRAKVRNMDPDARDAAYADFNPEYNNLIAKMGELEDRGAYQIMNKEIPEDRPIVEVPPAREVVPPQPEGPAAEPGLQTPGAQPIPPHNTEIMGMAAAGGLVDKQGRPVPKYVRNVVNAYLRDVGRPELPEAGWLPMVDTDTMTKAIARHKRVQIEGKVKSKITADDIMKLADKQQREAAVKAAGMLTRRNVEEMIRNTFQLTDIETTAAMVLMDLHADQVAKNLGQTPSEATRDAWYTTHIADIVKGEDKSVIDDNHLGPNALSQQSVDGVAIRVARAEAALLNVFAFAPGETAENILRTARYLVINARKEPLVWNAGYEYLQAIEMQDWFQYAQKNAINPYDYRELFAWQHSLSGDPGPGITYQPVTPVRRELVLHFEKIIDTNGDDFYITAGHTYRIERSHIRTPGEEWATIIRDKRYVGTRDELMEAIYKDVLTLVPDEPANYIFQTKLNQVLKSSSDMTPDQLRYALLHDDLTGLKSRRAYREDPKKDFQLIVDMEGLKYVNDKYGHKAGDQVMVAAAKVIQDAAGVDNAYRGSDRGDELIAQFDTYEQAQRALSNMQEWIDAQEIELNGKLMKGLGLGAGIGRTLEEADAQFNRIKPQLVAEGKRARRGEKPVNLRPVLEGLVEGEPVLVSKGSTKVLEDGRAVIRALTAPDVSTLVHEIGHIFRRDLGSQDIDVVARLGGLKDGNELLVLEKKFWADTTTPEEAQIYSRVEDMFARGWERYLAEGDAPKDMEYVDFSAPDVHLRLRSIFQKFTDWMLKIYTKLFKQGGRILGTDGTPLDVNIRATIDGISLREIFDRMLVGGDERPKTWDQLVAQRSEDIKGTGRNWRFTAQELVDMAKKELAAEILQPYKSVGEALKAADEMTDYPQLRGDPIHDTAIYDAIDELSKNPSIDPWKTKQVRELRGTKTTARGITNVANQYDFQFKVIDLADVQASHVWKGDRLVANARYPQELQPRLRENADPMMQVDSIARTLEPDELLYDARALDRGAPIVGPDNNVESGNGRALALQRAADMYPERYQAYKDALIAAAPGLGIDPAEFADMAHPVLVRERQTDVNRVDFVNDANKPIALQMNTLEVAVNDARHISDADLRNLNILEDETIEGALVSPRNTPFISKFLAALSPNERAELSDNGTINKQGIERLTNALFSKVYEGQIGERMLRAFTMSMDTGVKAAQQAVMASLPQIARAEGQIAGGLRAKDLTIAADIAAAVDKLATLRAGKQSVTDYLGQTGLMEPELTGTQRGLLKFFSEQRQAKNIRELLRAYAAGVDAEPNPKQLTMFGDVTHSKEEILNAAIKSVIPEAIGFFAPAPAPIPAAVPPAELAGAYAGRPGVPELPPAAPGVVRPAGEPVAPGAEPGTAAGAEPGTITPPAKPRTPQLLRGVEGTTPLGLQPEAEPTVPAYTIETPGGEVIGGNRPYLDYDPGLPFSTKGKATLGVTSQGLKFLRGAANNPGTDRTLIYRAFDKPFVQKMIDDGWITDRAGKLYLTTEGLALFNQARAWKPEKLKPTAPTTAEGARAADFQEDWQHGRAIPFDELKNIDLTKITTRPTSTIAQELKDTYTFGNAGATSYAHRYIDWIANGRKGDMPATDNPARGGNVRARVDADTRVSKLDAYNEELSSGKRINVKPVPESGLFVTLVIPFKHGEHNIIGKVYSDGQAIAFYPDSMGSNAPVDVNGGVTRILGIDSTDPTHMVYSIDGDIQRINIDKPQVGPELFQAGLTSERWYYSKLEQVIRQRMPNAATAEQIKGIISGNVKADELKWTGFDDWLNSHPKVTKVEALDFIRNNSVEVKEVVKGQRVLARDEAGNAVYDGAGGLVESVPGIKFSQFALPGGENYRELLFTLPVIEELPPGYKVTQHDGIWGIEFPDGHAIEGWSTREGAIHSQRSQPGSPTYQSAHWQEPNVLAHVRFDDRVDADGKKVLFVEEMQSDWHQAGRKKGYGPPNKERWISDNGWKIVENPADSTRAPWEIVDENGHWQYQGTSRTDVLNNFELRGDQGVPPAPFAKTWPDLTMKRMLRWAAENGYDKVAWTTGEQQAARYDLRKQIDSLYWNEGTGELGGEKDGREIFMQHGVTKDNLADRIGKDAANVAIKMNPEPDGWRNIEGENLAVGGEGMKTFYDKMLPELMNKYAKKWGARVGETGIKNTENANANLDYAVIGDREFGYQVMDMRHGGGELVSDKVYPTQEEAYATFYKPSWDTVHSIDVTPEMRASAMQGQELFQSAAEPISQTPPNGTPATDPVGKATEESYVEDVRPALSRMRQEYKDRMGKQFRLGDIDPSSQQAVRTWLNGVRNDMASTKLAAISYGEQMRDSSMLNYSRRYGVDNILGLGLPYELWYTRTMVNWAKRMVDRPTWFGMYARLKEMQDKLAHQGMPTRLKGKVRLPMPWLPEWAGGGLYIDPVKQLLPFVQFGQPIEQFGADQNQLIRRAESVVDEMASAEKTSPAAANEAKSTHAGALWDQALKQAELDLDKTANPLTLATMMISPALWWTIPMALAQGKPEKIGVLPITRTGQTIRTLGKGTFAEPVTTLVGSTLAGPEEMLRKAGGLSQFGQWGEYYIDRQLGNMAADGTVSSEQAQIAMVERKGPIFDQAKARVEYEQAFRTPGASAIMSLKAGAKPGEVLGAVLTTIFGGSLFPTGELELRGLKPEYDNAWRKLEAGDVDALNTFFDQHPEYEARLALYDQPEERLKQFLISAIWDKYTKLEQPNRSIASKTLGQRFIDSFLDKETRSYDALDNKTLAMWAQQLGAMIPQTEETKNMPEMPKPEYYQPELVEAINLYRAEKNRRFPNIYAIQSNYYAYPVGTQRRNFLARWPQLKQYWDWKANQAVKHPELAPYFEDLKANATMEPIINELTAPLVTQLYSYALGGRLTAGATDELMRIKNLYAPGMNFTDFLEMLVTTVYK